MTVITRKRTKRMGKPGEKRTHKVRTAGVRVVYPDQTPNAIRRGRQLAEQVRKELAGLNSQSLNETMSQLRGREWS